MWYRGLPKAGLEGLTGCAGACFRGFTCIFSIVDINLNNTDHRDSTRALPRPGQLGTVLWSFLLSSHISTSHTEVLLSTHAQAAVDRISLSNSSLIDGPCARSIDARFNGLAYDSVEFASCNGWMDTFACVDRSSRGHVESVRVVAVDVRRTKDFAGRRYASPCLVSRR